MSGEEIHKAIIDGIVEVRCRDEWPDTLYISESDWCTLMDYVPNERFTPMHIFRMETVVREGNIEIKGGTK